MKTNNLLCACVLAAASHCVNAEQILRSNFSENEYESVEKVFANNTGHIDRLVEFIQMNALPQNHPKEAFLDIGAGPATIASQLSKVFKSITVIDPNKAFEPIYQEKGFISHIGNFQDTQIEGQYDVILCSHVLYYIPHPEWASFLGKMHGLIRSGGRGIVLMVAPEGKWHALRSSINPEYSHSGIAEKALKELDISYDLIPVQSVFKVPNYDDFRALLRLFTIDDCFLPEAYQALSDSEKEQIDQKIDDYIADCLQPDGSYEFIDEDVYIVMHND